MGGQVSKQLDQTVTHLVADSCDSSSEKYRVCHKLKLPVLLIDWINDAWYACKGKHFFDVKSPETLKKYSIPLFKGCVITVSGFTSSERSNIGQLIELNGGVFSGQMSKISCTHLITSLNSGAKYRKALQWGTIKIVDVKWLKKSIELEYRLPEEKFNRTDSNITNVVSSMNVTSGVGVQPSTVDEPPDECSSHADSSFNAAEATIEKRLTQNFSAHEQSTENMEVGSVHEEGEITKKAISVFELIEKSAKENEKQNSFSRSNSSLLPEKRRRTSLGSNKMVPANRSLSHTDNAPLKLPGEDLDMAQRGRNVMEWVEQCSRMQLEDLEREKPKLALTDSTNVGKAKSKRNISAPLGEMVINMHQELLSSSYPLRATEFKKEILSIIEKFELVLFDEQTNK